MPPAIGVGRAGSRGWAALLTSEFDPDLFVTGTLPFIVIAAALLTAPVSALLLRLYRRAVVRAMGESAGVVTTPPPLEDAGPAPERALDVEWIDAATARDLAASAADEWRALSRAARRATVVYLLGGSAFAVVLTMAWIAQAGDGFGPTRFAAIGVIVVWPVVLTLELAVAATRRERATVLAGYVAIVVVVAGYALAVSPDLTIGDLVTLWLISNLPATVVMLAFLRRSVRAVGPLVLAFMLIAVAGSLIVSAGVVANDAALEAVVDAGISANLGAREILVVLMLVGFALFGAIGWVLLRITGFAYRRRRTSDLEITLDSLWLTFGVVEGSLLASDGWPWLFSGLAAFAAWWIVTRIGFRLLPGGVGGERSLLLLRVFALGARSERALDVLAQRWRRGGSIELIAGPDLVTSTIEPHEFLDYVGGRLSRSFVSGADDLDRRVATRARGADPDGRFRVNEFFCRADTWQPTMTRLATEADAVLMDLRSFSPTNQGCIFELSRLLAVVSLERVVLVADETTDEAFLRETLESLWSRVPADSPNRTLATPTVRVFRLGVPQRDQMVALVRLLVGVASAPGALQRAPASRD